MSGIITALLKHPDLGIEIPPGEIPLTSDRYLGKTNLIRGFLLKEDSAASTITWLVGPHRVPYLKIKNKRFGVLKLKRTTKNTNWLLESNIAGGGDVEGDAGAGTSTAAPEPTPAPAHDGAWYHPEPSWYSDMSTNYQSLQTGYNDLYGQYSTLQDNYNALSGSYSTLSDNVSTLQSNYSSMHTSMSNLQQNFEDERNENSDFRAEMHNMVNSIFQWHIHEHPRYAPPPPPPPQ